MYAKETILSEDQAFGKGFEDVFGSRSLMWNDAVVSSNAGSYAKGWWWLSSDDGDGNARDVNNDGSRNYNYADKRNGAVRPDSLLMNCKAILKNRSEKVCLGRRIPCLKAKEPPS